MLNFKRTVILASALLVGGLTLASAAGPCDGVTPCQLPGTTSLATPTTTVTQIAGLQVRNAAAVPANVTGTNYWFFATTITSPNTTTGSTDFVDDGSGNRVRSAFSLQDNNVVTSTNDLMTNGRLTNLKAATAYHIYVQACLGGSNQASPNCSDWVEPGYSPKTTGPLPTNPFKKPVSADVTTNHLNVNVDSTKVTSTDILNASFTITSLFPSVVNTVIYPVTYPGGFVVGLGNGETSPADYAFSPNVEYQYTGQLEYPYNQFTVSETTGPFWTTPVNPGPIVINSWTHCSANISVTNASGNPPNPTYTPYKLTLAGTGGPFTITQKISGAGLAADTTIYVMTGLTSGATYTTTAQALVGSGTVVSVGNNSGNTTGANIVTDAWGGSFSVSGITTTSATFNVGSLLGAASISSWSVLLNGVFYSSGTGDPTGALPITGLTPNKDYTLQITLVEGSGCSSTLPVTPLAFTTLAATPQVPTSYGAITATTLNASFTDALNQNGSHYGLTHCTDAGFTAGCVAQDVGPKAASGLQTAAVSSLSPETTYFFEVYTKKISGTGVDSSSLSFTASAVTLNQAPVITSAASCTPVGTTANCTVTATDNGGASALVFTWTVNPAAISISPNASSTSFNTTMSFASNGVYVATVTVTDHNGGGLSTISTTSFTIGQTPTSITVAPSSATFNTGGSSLPFTATVRDQFGFVISGASVNWSLNNNVAGSTNPAFGITTWFTPGITSGTYVLQAGLGSAAGSAGLNIIFAGPYFTTHPFGVINTGNKTANMTALADDLSAHGAITYTWSLESGPGPISASPNGTAASSNTVVTFTQAGTYYIRCTATDNNGSGSEVTLTPIIVAQTLTSIHVTPADSTVAAFNQLQLTAAGLDQFAQAMSSFGAVTWSVDGGGSISAAGLFSAVGVGQHFTVTALSNGISGTARVTVINYDVSGAKAFPVPYKSTLGNVIHFSGLGSDSHIRIYTTSGRKVIELTSNQDTLDWDVKNSDSEKLASGVYFYVIESPTSKKNGKLIIIQ